jgi:AcrR family transcriptional regulator
MSDPAPSPRLPRGAGRAALLDAAVRVVARHGLRGLTYRSVAAEAGVNQTLVAHHFGNRRALIAEALRAATDATAGTAHPAHVERLEDFARHLSGSVTDDEELHAFLIELALEARRHPDLVDENRATYDRYFETTRRALEAVGIPATPALARLVFATLDGLVLQQLVFADPVATDEAAAELRRLLRAVRAGERNGA